MLSKQFLKDFVIINIYNTTVRKRNIIVAIFPVKRLQVCKLCLQKYIFSCALWEEKALLYSSVQDSAVHLNSSTKHDYSMSVFMQISKPSLFLKGSQRCLTVSSYD